MRGAASHEHVWQCSGIVQVGAEVLRTGVKPSLWLGSGLESRLVQSEAEAAREQTEARLLEVERAARRKHEELDSRAARLEAQLHQQGLDMDSYRRRSEAEASRLQQLLDIAQKAQRYLSSTCSVATSSRMFAMTLFFLVLWSPGQQVSSVSRATSVLGRNSQSHSISSGKYAKVGLYSSSHGYVGALGQQPELLKLKAPHSKQSNSHGSCCTHRAHSS